jgi:hypothetical protein
MVDLSSMSNEELVDQLVSECIYYDERLYSLCKIICKELPRKMVYRIISKLYRLRTR